MASKFFILDTNVFLHNPEALNSFSDNTVVIPITVIEELDRFKSTSDKKGMHARSVLRTLDELIHKGALKEKGAKLPSGGKLIIATDADRSQIPDLDPRLNDNKILSVAWNLQRQGMQVFFISKDMNARIKGEALGIKSRDYEKQKVDYAELYKGWRELILPAGDIDLLTKSGSLALKGISLFPNECAWIKSIDNPDASLIARYHAKDDTIHHIKSNQEAMGIRPVNLEQHFAFDLLMDDSVQLISLIGPAGTGKTLLAIACGLEQILGDKPKFEKMLVARPIVPLGKDIGYLPGTKDQKLNYWMQPIFDNLNYLLSKEEHDKGVIKPGNQADKTGYLIDSGIVEIEAITYIRGRSIPNQFIIIDEAQNLTPHEVKTIVSRAGKGTKIVLTGDPEQIDNPYLDADSNGLAYTAERMKQQTIAGHMLLSKSERSELASIAAEIL